MLLKIENVLKYLLIIGILVVLITEIIFNSAKNEQFDNPIAVDLVAQENGSYSAKIDLEAGINYGVVISAIINQSSNRSGFPPILRINGIKYKFLESRSKILGNNKLKFNWVNGRKSHYEKNYLGSFFIEDEDEYEININWHLPKYLGNYELTLHENVDESYYYIGWVRFFFGVLLILVGWLFKLFLFLKRFLLWIINCKDKLLNKLKKH